jgi:hypothetical protein
LPDSLTVSEKNFDEINVNRSFINAVILGLIMITIPVMVSAGSLEKLVMPGPVIQGHAKYEDKCTLCHTPFEKKSQNIKCLDCHKAIAKDISSRQGFHGRKKGLAKTACKYCHKEHIGRGADIVHLDIETFNHGLTDFTLEGAHKKTRCNACHLSGKKHREAPSTCLACHKSDDKHAGKMGKVCSKCHSQTTWSKAKFDHDKKTKFPLKGRHRKAKCSDCHPNEQYKKTPKVCVSCHTLNDKHAGQFGKKCKTCHVEDDWKKSLFSHDRDTKFVLKESHVKLSCKTCHKGNLYKEKLKTTCLSCHLNDDEHKGRFGPKCETCHSSKKWRQVGFNHDRDTKFKLIDNHIKLGCQDCHKGIIAEEKLGTGCHDCHNQDDVHKGEQGKKCDRCHNQQQWGLKVKFDHDQTRFPLQGLHVLTSCEGCHLTPTYKKTPTKCVECHLKNDVHKKTQGTECGLCHNPVGWDEWTFDHNIQTEFLINGSHKNLQCRKCHAKPMQSEIRIPSTCIGCHKSDDVHKGQQGQRCDRCHNEVAWGDNIQFDHDLSRFPLIGLHAITTCESCHISSEFKNIKSDCIDCHKNDDIHKDTLGNKCAACHNPNGWELWKFDHNASTKFKLDGSHEGLECGACHILPVKEKIKLSKVCNACHGRDDRHQGRFGKKCDRCHDTTSFKNIRMGRQNN